MKRLVKCYNGPYHGQHLALSRSVNGTLCFKVSCWKKGFYGFNGYWVEENEHEAKNEGENMNYPSIREIVETLTTQEIEEVILNFSQFEKDGYIGNCKLRDCVNKASPIWDTTIAMREVAFECYRLAYHRKF